MIQTKVIHTNNEIQEIIFGNLEEIKKKIEEQYYVRLKIDSEGLLIEGEISEINKTETFIKELSKRYKHQGTIDPQMVNYLISNIDQFRQDAMSDYLDLIVTVTERGKAIKPKTLGQRKYIDKINTHDIVFGIGPAGTGKTYLAIAMAIKGFKNNEVQRIVLTRPAVEAGESLGFLPGDLQEKVDPYLRPIYDAMNDILGFDNFIKLKEKGLIEVAPLAYMRGRTLDNAFVILDEAQNTTNEQMKMFLTRIGFGSKAIITGDITQIDLPRGKTSGLMTARKVLSKIKKIGFMELEREDIVRHPLVQAIIEAYEAFEKKKDED